MDPIFVSLVVLGTLWFGWNWGRASMRMQIASATAPQPEPMVDIREALVPIKDAREALERAERAWNRDQLWDALNSSMNFIALAQTELARVKPQQP